eukprot:TRINITY_DN17785_c0_g1_i1.p1 TRINITY_DN17785_c0_g1~~TRINITY_DN17785_c0_g1_i1.p1  ORF type:complete len:804 (+),score=120.04 TRINITY_DN17785_c0_g1_i1:76-2487(+)
MKIPDDSVLAVSGFCGSHERGNGLYVLRGEYLSRPYYTHITEDLHIYSFGARWALGSSVGPMRPLQSGGAGLASDIWAVCDPSSTQSFTVPSGVWAVRAGVDQSSKPCVTSDIDLFKLQWEDIAGVERLTAHHLLGGLNSYAVITDTHCNKLLEALHESCLGLKSGQWTLPDTFDLAFARCRQALGCDGATGQMSKPSQRVAFLCTSLGGFPVLQGDMCFQPSQSRQEINEIPAEDASFSEKASFLPQLFFQCKAVQELVPLLEDLHQILYSEATSLDTTCMQRSLHYDAAASVLGETLAGSDKIEITSECCKVSPGDLICIESDFYKVEGLGSILLSPPLLQSVSDGVTVYRLDAAPLILAGNANDGVTQAFFDNVLKFDPDVQPSADDICLRLAGEHLPSPAEPENRKKALIRIYTQPSLYSQVNRSMYKNEVDNLHKYGGYIRELKEVFLQGQEDPVVVPYKGDVARGGYFTSDMIKGWREKMVRGQHLCWPSFTSTSTTDGDSFGASFPGDVKFRIRCFKLGEPQCGKYYPAKVKEFSVFKDEDEVVFPPHCVFRFLNISSEDEAQGTGVTIVDLETVDFPSVWQVIENEDWNRFQEWVLGNTDRIDTAKKEHSIIGAVVDAITKPVENGVPDPVAVCIQSGASPNEIDKKTGEIPIVKIAKKLVQPGGGDLTSIFSTLVGSGANPFLAVGGNPSASSILMMNKIEIPGMTEKYCWQFSVDDGVDGKSVGWYDYAPAASEGVERAFQQWLEASKSGSLDMVRGISSGSYSYTVDFLLMRQRNEKTDKMRDIMRTKAAQT